MVYLYEAYQDPAAFDKHANHDPYRKWNDMAEETMDQVTDVIPLTESLASNADE